MMQRISLGLLSTCIALWGMQAQAMSLRELKALTVNKKTGEIHAYYYLIGTMEGIKETHDANVREGAKPWLCIGKKKYAPHMAQTIFKTELLRNAGVYEAEMPAELVMRNAMLSVYGC